LTVDEIGDKLVVGGPGYYGGWALHLLGCEVHLVSSMSDKYRSLYRELYGVFRIHEVPCDSNPRFIIRNGRAVGLVEEGCSIPVDYLENVIDDVGPDLVVFSPVYGELNGKHIVRVKDRFTSMDIQGFTRRIVGGDVVNVWSDELFRLFRYVDLVHGNIREYTFTNRFSELISRIRSVSEELTTGFFISMDERGLYLIHSGRIYYFPPVEVEVVSDVGAGDILLAVTSYYMCRGYGLLESTIRGLSATLSKISSRDRIWFDEKRIEEGVKQIKFIEIP